MIGNDPDLSLALSASKLPHIERSMMLGDIHRPCDGCECQRPSFPWGFNMLCVDCFADRFAMWAVAAVLRWPNAE